MIEVLLKISGMIVAFIGACYLTKVIIDHYAMTEKNSLDLKKLIEERKKSKND